MSTTISPYPTDAPQAYKYCDWHDCMAVAIHSVRVDIPRGHHFTSLIWRRCGAHAPKEVQS